MKVLAISNLFPNARQPNRGVFNLQQWAALRPACQVQVIAPIAWQPWRHGRQRPAPYQECWRGIPTFHPFYYYTPGVGRAAYAAWMYLSLRPTLTRVVRDYRPDVLLAAWAYPDAVATALLARQLALPYVAKVQGSDINLLPRMSLVTDQIRWALRQAARTLAVSQALKEQLVAIGVPAAAVRVLHNGVNLQQFALQDHAAARQLLNLPAERRIVLYVGNLLLSKGAGDLVAAARHLAADPTPPLIVLVGGGRDQEKVAAQVRRAGLAAHVRLVGPRPHAEIGTWMGAADVFCLPSHREGCPNVVLEALACGRPVVASRVGAIPDLVDEQCGRVVAPQAPAELAGALRAVLGQAWEAAALRERVRPLSWEANARGLAEELERAVQHHKHPATTGTEPASARHGHAEA